MNICEVRNKAGLTQEQLAANLRVRQSTVAMWENGTNNPRAALLPKLAQVLGCSIDELMGFDGSARAESSNAEFKMIMKEEKNGTAKKD